MSRMPRRGARPSSPSTASSHRPASREGAAPAHDRRAGARRRVGRRRDRGRVSSSCWASARTTRTRSPTTSPGKAAELRIFRDADGRTNLSLLEIGGAALVVSQFTLYADTRRGRRPGFTAGAGPELAERLYLRFAAALSSLGVTVATGTFGAEMAVELVNDGPFTIWLDTADR